jgi:hypothetical protein
MACGVAMDYLLRAQARSGGLHRQAKAWKGAAGVVALQAAMAKAAVPSGQAKMASHAKSWLQRLSQDLKLAGRRCTSICGLTT